MALGKQADLSVNIDGDASGLIAASKASELALARANRSVDRYNDSLVRLSGANMRLEREMQAQADQHLAARTAALEKQSAALEQVGRGAVYMGTGMAAGLGLAGAAAMRWESDFAGVLKVVDGTPQQLQEVEDGLRSLAKELPASHSEIAAVAEAAGQLGVKRKDIVSFTRTMLDMGATTNLASDDAATGLARFSNIMGTANSESDRLGSTLVALGNNGASTEAEILSMSLRIAAAGKQAGLSEGDVMGFATTLSDLGVQAELGGTAASQAILKMNGAVIDGGAKLEDLADTAGVTADVFARKWSTNPIAAFNMWLDGLRRIEAQGGNVQDKIAELGGTGTRFSDVIGRLVASGDRLTQQTQLGNEAFVKNNALQEEAAKRYATTESEVRKSWNALVDFGIDVGNGVLPVVGDLARLGSDVVSVFSAIPDPVMDVIGPVTAAATAVTLFGGAWLIARAKIQRSWNELAETTDILDRMNKRMAVARGAAGVAGLTLAMADFGDQTSTTGKVVSTFTSTASAAATGFAVGGPWGAAIGGGIGLLSGLAGAFFGSSDAADQATQSQTDYASSLNSTSGAITRQTRELVAHALAESGALEMARELRIDQALLTSAVLGNKSATAALNEEFDRQRAYLLGSKVDFAAAADAANRYGGANESAAGMQQKWAAAHGESLDKLEALQKLLGIEGNKLDEDIEKKRDEIAATRKWTDRTDDATESVQDNTQAIRANIKQLEKRALAILENTDKTVAFEEAVDAARRALRGNNDVLDLSTKRGRDNYQVIRDQIAAALDFRDGTRKQRDAIQDTLKTLVAFRNEARQNGEKVPAWINRQIAKFKEMAREANAALANIQDEPVDVTLTPSAARIAKVEWQLNRATGGPVYGPGTATSDSIPARLSNGERVTAAHIIDRAGKGDNRRGQAVMKAIELMILRGELGKMGDVPVAFRDGGAVLPNARMVGLPRAIDSVEAQLAAQTDSLSALLSAAISKAITFLPTAGALGPGGRLTPAQVVRGQTFLRAQDGKPYGWGGVGPGSYDCSGLQNAGLNAAMGRHPYSRTFGATGNMPWAGSAPGVGQVTIGWFTGNPGHTSANWGGMGAESAGGVGVRIGSDARSPLDSMFNGVMHYDAGGMLHPGITLAVNRTGQPERVTRDRGGSRPGRDFLNLAEILKILARIDYPEIRDYNQELRVQRRLYREMKRDQERVNRLRAIARDRGKALAQAERELDKARDRSQTARDRIKDAERALADAQRVNSKAVRQAERDLKRARKDGTRKEIIEAERALERARRKVGGKQITRLEENLAEARKKGATRVREFERERRQFQRTRERDVAINRRLSKAERELEGSRNRHAKAVDRTRAAFDAMKSAAEGFAEAVESQGAIFGGSGTSTSAQGILAKLTGAGDDAEAFEKAVARLRRRRVDEDIVQQILDQGSTPEGLAAAQSLARADKAMLLRINRAQSRLERQARQVGALGIRGPRQVVNNRTVNLNFNGDLVADNPRRLARDMERRQRDMLAMAGR